MHYFPIDAFVFVSVVLNALIFADRSNAKNVLALTAVSESPYTLQLYRILGNVDTPPDTDPAKFDDEIREGICEEISRSGVFRVLELVPDEIKSIYRTLRQLYKKMEWKPFYLAEFHLTRAHLVREYVFMCLLRRWTTDEVFSFFVSKEYDVGSFADLYMPGRFLFMNFATDYHTMMLAEYPATAHTQAGFNVELYYLHMRKYIEPAVSNRIDPLCKLVSIDRIDPRNQHHRLCVAVARSFYFKLEMKYPRHTPCPCHRQEIAFKTTDGAREAAGQSFYERMTLCPLVFYERRNAGKFLYISRGYMSNAVFVYRRNPVDNKIYLENVSTNINVVDELNSFDFVE